VKSFTNNIHPDKPCNHIPTLGSPLGSAWTVSPDTAVCNIPFASPGKLHGLFYKKQWQDVFKQPMDNVFMPSWNEFQIGPIEMTGWDLNNTYFHSMGSENDPNAYVFFLDGFGTERSRTTEPTVFDNGYYYKLLQSCSRVAKLLRMWEGDSCIVENEECCVYNSDEYYANVWSLQNADGSEALISSDEQEVEMWKLKGWKEMCNPWGGPTEFCADQNAPWHPWNNYDVLRGPFLIFANTSDDLPNTAPLYRCANTAGLKFFSSQNDCEGLGTKEYLMGFVSFTRSSATPRSLHRCFGKSTWYQSLDGPCKPGDKDQGIIGYVV